MSLNLSICHIVGNHMSRLINEILAHNSRQCYMFGKKVQRYFDPNPWYTYIVYRMVLIMVINFKIEK